MSSINENALNLTGNDTFNGTIWTVSPNVHSMVNSLHVTNKTGSAKNIWIDIWPAGDSVNTIRLRQSTLLNDGQTLNFDGTMVLENTGTADLLKIKADSGALIDVQISCLDRANAGSNPLGLRRSIRGLTTQQTLYTVPAARASAVDHLQFLNVSGGSVTVDMEIDRTGADPKVVDTIQIDANQVFEWAGTLHMKAAQLLKVTASAAVDVNSGILEAT